MMNIDQHSMTYNLVSAYLGEVQYDFLEVTFAITFQRLRLAGGIPNFEEMRVTEKDINFYFDAIDKRITPKILETCPIVDVDLIKQWREK